MEPNDALGGHALLLLTAAFWVNARQRISEDPGCISKHFLALGVQDKRISRTPLCVATLLVLNPNVEGGPARQVLGFRAFTQRWHKKARR